MTFYKIRKKLFWLMFALFFVAGSIFVVYSFGYRLDTKNWEITQTGGLNVKTSPKVTEIILDGEKVNKKASLFSNEVFLEGLIPGSHFLEVLKEGYFTWTKNVEIKPKMVENFTNIVLLPKNPLRETIYNATTSEEIIDILPLEGSDEILLEIKEKNKLGTYQILKIFNKNNANFSEIYKKKISASDNLNLIKNLIIDKGNYSHFLINYYDRSLKKQVFYLWEKSNPEQASDFSKVLNEYFSNQPIKVLFHPFEYNKFFVSTAKKIGVLDLDKKEVNYLSATNPLDFNINNNSLFWIDKVGGFYSYNLILKNITPISILEGKDLSIEKMLISSNSENILIFLNDGKIILARPDGSLKEIEENIKNPVFSPDNKKIAYISGGVVKVYFLSDMAQDIFKKSGEGIDIFITDNIISNLVWFKDSFHLMIRSGNSIFFAEIDDRDEINVFELPLGSGDSYWNSEGFLWQFGSKIVEKINLMIGG
jgi:hypothetical protein